MAYYDTLNLLLMSKLEVYFLKHNGNLYRKFHYLLCVLRSVL